MEKQQRSLYAINSICLMYSKCTNLHIGSSPYRLNHVLLAPFLNLSFIFFYECKIDLAFFWINTNNFNF
jgi:hypothetical protein